ncbi:MAG: type II toxin-antitoxin system RelE family toxin [Actinomycetota bacterium]
MAYEVEITPEALRHLNRLPEKVRAAVMETILGSIAANPRRPGKPLNGELEGFHSARRGEFRVIYEVDEAGRVVLSTVHSTGGAPTAGAEEPVVDSRWSGRCGSRTVRSLKTTHNTHNTYVIQGPNRAFRFARSMTIALP